MGWIVYDTRNGRMEKYYKKAATARRIVTVHNQERTYDWGSPGIPSYTYRPDSIWACCSYRDYEGVLMGLEGPALKMWQFCNTERG